jgi:hypothetical protein
MLALAAAASASCEKEKKKKAQVKAIVSTADNPISGLGLMVGSMLTARNQWDRVSFTPESVKLTISGVKLCTSAAVVGTDIKCSADSKEILIENQQEIELIGKEKFDELFSATAEIEEDKFGTYRGFHLFTPENPPIFTVSGAVTVGTETYHLNGLKIPLGGGVSGIMPTDLNIAADTSPVLQLFFDIDKAFNISHFGSATCDTAYSNVARVTDPDACIGVHSVGLLPYMGNGNPTISKYELTITSDYLYKDMMKLRLMMLFDEAGQIVDLNWVPIYASTLAAPEGSPPPLMPCGVRNALGKVTKNSDGSYKIESQPCHENQAMTIDAFKLENHSGSFTYGGTSYTYTAEKK